MSQFKGSILVINFNAIGLFYKPSKKGFYLTILSVRAKLEGIYKELGYILGKWKASVKEWGIQWMGLSSKLIWSIRPTGQGQKKWEICSEPMVKTGRRAGWPEPYRNVLSLCLLRVGTKGMPHYIGLKESSSHNKTLVCKDRSYVSLPVIQLLNQRPVK